MAFSDSARRFVEDVGRVNVIGPAVLVAAAFLIKKGRLRIAALAAAAVWLLVAVLYSARSVSASVSVPTDEISITYH